TYAVIGHELLKGRSLYSDLWDHKPPAIHITFSIAEKIVGYGQSEIYFLGLVTALLTLLGIYRAGSLAGSGVAGGLWAAAIWTVISSDMILQANLPNTEAFINAILIWTFLLLASSQPKMWHMNLAGILLALGTLYKPQIVIFAFLFSAASFFFMASRKRFLNTMKTSLRLTIPTLIAWTSCFYYFRRKHHLNDFWDTQFTFNRFYGGNLISNLIKGFHPQYLAPSFMWFLAPVVLLMLVGFILSFRRLEKSWLFLAAYMAGVCFSVSVAGMFFRHYYQFWLPVLSVGGGWAIVMMGKRLKAFTQGLYLLPGILCIGFLIFYEAPNYLLDANNWSIEKFDSSLFIKDKQLGDLLSRNLKPGQSFYLVGQEPSVYFYSRKSPPVGLVYTTPATWGPLSNYLTAKLLTDLANAKPDVLIFYKSGYLTGTIPVQRYHLLTSYPQDQTFKIWGAGPVSINHF
ncbi:MAG TPA: hypothetical protein VN963_01615, partial [bacterium]|nr:hypothetical protein [bacterium]